jgi:hypothetical protein
MKYIWYRSIHTGKNDRAPIPVANATALPRQQTLLMSPDRKPALVNRRRDGRTAAGAGALPAAIVSTSTTSLHTSRNYDQFEYDQLRRAGNDRFDDRFGVDLLRQIPRQPTEPGSGPLRRRYQYPR